MTAERALDQDEGSLCARLKLFVQWIGFAELGFTGPAGFERVGTMALVISLSQADLQGFEVGMVEAVGDQVRPAPFFEGFLPELLDELGGQGSDLCLDGRVEGRQLLPANMRAIRVEAHRPLAFRYEIEIVFGIICILVSFFEHQGSFPGVALVFVFKPSGRETEGYFFAWFSAKIQVLKALDFGDHEVDRPVEVSIGAGEFEGEVDDERLAHGSASDQLGGKDEPAEDGDQDECADDEIDKELEHGTYFPAN